MAKRPPPKPTPRTPDKGALALEVLRRMREGESLRSIAASVGVPYSTLQTWMVETVPEGQYARAREAQADAHADEALAVAAQAARGELDPQGARLLVDTLKWRAAKFHRHRYGDQQQVEHSGAVGLTVAYQREGRRG